MSYIGKLKESSEKTGSIICMGIDPVCEYMPEVQGTVEDRIGFYFVSLFSEMLKRKVAPAAFKPNLGFFAALDRPRENLYYGSRALANILSILDENFAHIPTILDYKRGDIARSSDNYAKEGFV